MIVAAHGSARAQDVALPDDPALLNREIIVEGERRLKPEELEGGVEQFVQRTLLGAPVRRFPDHFCVAVLGVSPASSKAIAARIRNNARAVGLKPAEEGCSVNAVAIITDRPQAAYKALLRYQTHFVGMPDFRDYDLPVVESALKKRAPAISFSTNTGIGWQWADVVRNTTSSAGFWGWTSLPSAYQDGITRATSAVLIDATKLRGVHALQLADFITVHLLGSPRRTARTAEPPVPSILTLFDQPPQLAPQRLTTFDRAYLCAIHRPRWQIPASRLKQTMLDVYDSECVRVGAPAE